MNSITIKDKLVKKLYECQCGKRYYAFAGLYLHFQRKHQKKISTAPSPNEYKQYLRGSIKIITYFCFDHSPSGIDNEYVNKQKMIDKLKIIFQDFLKSCYLEKYEKELAYAVMERFRIYLESILKASGSCQEYKFMENIPLRFNSFYETEQHQNKHFKKNFKVWRKSIVLLGQWLQYKGYTDLITQPNTQFSIDF